MKVSTREFLEAKMGHYPLREIFFLQIESILIWIFGGIPSIIGFSLRTAIYKIIFRKLEGFAWIQPRVQFVHTNNLSIGRFFGCNSGTYINAVGGITIGNFVLIGSNVTISSGLHPIEGKTPEIFFRPLIPKQIIIEDDVWIGANTVIMPGVTLKKGTVVGAGSVVTKDTEEYSVVVGSPARKIRNRLERSE